MSALLLEHPTWATHGPGDRRSAASAMAPTAAPTSGGLTLDELITGVWEGLTARQTVRCPACGGAMGPAGEPGSRRIAGSCGDCGSGLI